MWQYFLAAQLLRRVRAGIGVKLPQGAPSAIDAGELSRGDPSSDLKCVGCYKLK